MKKKRHMILVAVLLLACTMTGVLGTLAYLQRVTETKKNTFQSDKDIHIMLREPGWDGYTFEDAQSQNGEGINPSYTGDTGSLGFTQAHSYVPGESIRKNPQVKNTGDTTKGVSTYVALKVQYFNSQGEEISYDAFRQNYLIEDGITFDTDNWTKLEKTNGELYGSYRYDSKLAPGQISSELFTQIPLSGDLTTGSDGRLPDFSIRVTAYAIQSENVESTNVNTLLYKFITNN